jgi:hypothetical protein
MRLGMIFWVDKVKIWLRVNACGSLDGVFGG